jgi:hypothetical protein
MCRQIRMVFDIVLGRMPDDLEPLEIDCPRCRGTGLVPINSRHIQPGFLRRCPSLGQRERGRARTTTGSTVSIG